MAHTAQECAYCPYSHFTDEALFQLGVVLGTDHIMVARARVRAHTHTQPVEIFDDSLYFFTCIFIYAAYEYACDIFVPGRVICVEVREKHLVTELFSHLLPFLLAKGLTEPGARLGASKPQPSSCLNPTQHWGYRCTHVHASLLHEHWGFELRT